PRPGRARRGDDRGPRRGGRRCARAPRGGARLPHAGGADQAVNELAVAAFAAETGQHLLVEPRGARFERFERGFDARRYVAELERRGLRWLPRSSPRFPRGLGAIFDAPPGLFLRGAAALELLERPAVALVGARACSPYGAHV